jgi:hypothetical protein
MSVPDTEVALPVTSEGFTAEEHEIIVRIAETVEKIMALLAKVVE